MSYMNGIKIKVGDVVELSPGKLSTLADMDLEKCTVLELDEADNRVKVVFNNNNAHNETFFDNDSTVDWFSTDRVIDIERDYQVMQITDTQDTDTWQSVAVVKMAPVIKQVNSNADGYSLSSRVSETDTDTFIFPGLSYHDLRKFKGTTNRLSLARFSAAESVVNGKSVCTYHPVFKIVDVEDIFFIP